MKVFSMIVGMYLITFCLFVLETGSFGTAATMGLVAALLKSGFSLSHSAVWKRIELARIEN